MRHVHPSWLLLLAIVEVNCKRDCAFVSRDISPDGRYAIELCRLTDKGAAMPGQSGDAEGTITLEEWPSGKPIRSTNIEMVQLMDTVIWFPSHVEIRLIADWPLPVSNSTSQ